MQQTAATYRWTPQIGNFSEETPMLTLQTQGLDDLGVRFAADLPNDDEHAGKVQVHVFNPSARGLPAPMLNYPLCGTIGHVLHKGHPTAELGYRIQDMMAAVHDPHLMPTFVDSGDVDRFVAAGSLAGLRQALVLIMTLPGVPVVHYLTEQAFAGQRGAMSAGGHASEGRALAETSAQLAHFIVQLTGLRKQNKVFSHGTPAILDDNANGPGVFAYKMTYGDSTAIVALNTSDDRSLTRTFATGLTGGMQFECRAAVGSRLTGLAVAADGTVTTALPPRSAFIWNAVNAS